MADYTVVCRNLKAADYILYQLCTNIEPRENFRIAVRSRREIRDIYGDRMKFISYEDVHTRSMLCGYRGTVLDGYAVERITSKHKIHRLADIHTLVLEKEQKYDL